MQNFTNQFLALGICFICLSCGIKAKNPGGSGNQIPGSADATPETNIGYIHFTAPVSTTLDTTVLHGLWQVIQPVEPVDPPPPPSDDSTDDPEPEDPRPAMEFAERIHFDTKTNKITKSSRCDFMQGTVLYVGTVSPAQFREGAIRVLKDQRNEVRVFTMYCSATIFASGFVNYTLNSEDGILTVDYPDGPVNLTKISDN